MPRTLVCLSLLLTAAARLVAQDTPALGPPQPAVAPQPESPPAPPELGGAAPITLLDAVEEALLQNPDIGISREAIRAAAGQRRTANGALLPPVTFSYAEIWQQQNKIQFPGSPAPVVIQPGNTRSFTLSSDWVVFAGGALRANQAIARIGEVAARHQLTATANEVIANTVEAYLQVLQAQEMEGVTSRTVELAREQVRVATVSFEAGAVPRVNVLRAEAALQNALQGQLQAANAVELARANLNRQMGRSQLAPVRVTPLERRLADPPELLASLQDAVRQRPELRAAQKAIDIDRERVRAARAGFYPSVAINSQYQRTANSGQFGSDDSFQVVGALRLNVWDWGQTSGRVRTASAGLQTARHRLEQAMQNIELQVRRAVLNIAEARRRVEVAEAEVTAGRQALEIERLRYTAGEGTYLELLDARRSFSQAEANLVNAFYDNSLAEAAWLAATGSYVRGDGSVRLPHGEATVLPDDYLSQGKNFDDLLEQYGLDPATGRPVTDDRE